MRYKFTFEKNTKDDVLSVFEAGEVDNNYAIMYEGTYALKEMQDASKTGAEQFITKLRRKNFFPDVFVAAKLYEATLEFFSKKSEEKIVVNYEDVESLVTEEEEEEEVEVEDLLKDDGDTSEDEIKEIDTEDDTPKFKPEDNSEHED
ncbi:MAG: hypothetical protein KAR45_18515 [Desulfobacteraceae bacterium]|nr:hypothetical protein [Desulfobacteraceae bacterium]